MNDLIVLLMMLVGFFLVVFLLLKLIIKLSEKKVIKNFLLWNVITVIVLAVFSFAQGKVYDLQVYGSFYTTLFSTLSVSSNLLAYASIFLGCMGLEKKQYWAFLPSILAIARFMLSG